MGAMDQRELSVEIQPAVAASIHTQTYQNPNGFRGILVGHFITNKKTCLTDGSDSVKTHVVISIEGSLVLEDIDSLLQKDGRLDRIKLVTFCKQRIPPTFLASKVNFLGLISYYPKEITHQEYIKDKFFLKKLYLQEKSNPKILIHLNSKSKGSESIISTSSKVILIDEGSWKQDVPINVLNLGQLSTNSYLKPKCGALVTSDLRDCREEEASKYLVEECQTAAQKIQSMAGQLFDSLQ